MSSRSPSLSAVDAWLLSSSHLTPTITDDQQQRLKTNCYTTSTTTIYGHYTRQPALLVKKWRILLEQFYCSHSHALADGKQFIHVREKMPEFSVVLLAPSLYLTLTKNKVNCNCCYASHWLQFLFCQTQLIISEISAVDCNSFRVSWQHLLSVSNQYYTVCTDLTLFISWCEDVNEDQSWSMGNAKTLWWFQVLIKRITQRLYTNTKGSYAVKQMNYPYRTEMTKTRAVHSLFSNFTKSTANCYFLISLQI